MGVDNFELEEISTPIITLADDGLIIKGNEDGEVISVRLSNDVFASELNLNQ